LFSDWNFHLGIKEERIVQDKQREVMNFSDLNFQLEFENRKDDTPIPPEAYSFTPHF